MGSSTRSSPAPPVRRDDHRPLGRVLHAGGAGRRRSRCSPSASPTRWCPPAGPVDIAKVAHAGWPWRSSPRRRCTSASSTPPTSSSAWASRPPCSSTPSGSSRRTRRSPSPTGGARRPTSTWAVAGVRPSGGRCSDQLGLTVLDVQPIGLAGSGGSTPLLISVAGDPDTKLFGKLYAMSHVRADRWYKLGRMVLYGRLEDEAPYHSVRRLVQYEDYALRLMQDLGIRTAAPYGIVEMTPEREYLLVTEFFDGAVEIGDADVDDSIIDQGLRLIRQSLGRRARPPRHQAGQPARPRRRARRHRRGLRPDPAVAVAGGDRPRQHDARPRRAHRSRPGLRAGPAVLHRGRDRRGVRRRPGHRQPVAAAGGPQERRPGPPRPVPGPRPGAPSDLAPAVVGPAHRPRPRARCWAPCSWSSQTWQIFSPAARPRRVRARPAAARATS